MMTMLRNLWHDEDLRKRVLFTLGVLIVFRLGSHITVPGINPSELNRFFQSLRSSGKTTSGIIDFISFFTGGALKQFAIFALGVMPYISSSIIMQLMQVTIPALMKLAQEGTYGRYKINRYTRIMTIVVAVIEAFGLLTFFKGQVVLPAQAQGFEVLMGIQSWLFSTLFVLILTAGTMFLLWLGEQTTERGVGNGVSLLIFAGIISRIPSVLFEIKQSDISMDQAGGLKLLLLFIIFLFFVAMVVILKQGERRVPVKYAKRVIGNKQYQGQSTYIPFKVDPAGVIAIIFASSLVLFPSHLMETFGADNNIIQKIVIALTPGTWLYYLAYIILVVFFCYFYTSILYNPLEISQQIQRNGGFVPGIRPGQQTSQYLERLLRKIILPGTVIVTFIAIAPTLISDVLGVSPNVAQMMGGTTVMIMVGVALDTITQIESKLLSKKTEAMALRRKTKKY